MIREPRPVLFNTPLVTAEPPDQVSVVKLDATLIVPLEPPLMVKFRSVLGVVEVPVTASVGFVVVLNWKLFEASRLFT